MGFLNLNLLGSGSELDPTSSIRRLQALFPETKVLPGNPLADEAARANQFFADELHADPTSPARHVVESLSRKAATYGPAVAFQIPLEGGSIIEGNIRRFDITFLYCDPLPESVRAHLVAFLKSFAVGRMETNNGGGVLEVESPEAPRPVVP